MAWMVTFLRGMCGVAGSVGLATCGRTLIHLRVLGVEKMKIRVRVRDNMEERNKETSFDM